MPRLEGFDGTSSVMRARRSSSRIPSSIPQPTPQYGHVVSTRWTTFAGVSFGRRAPVGHVATHWPHEVQTEDAMAPSPKTPTRVAWPRPRSEIAPICWTSSHATVQRPQRMHASRSRTKNDLVASTSERWSGACEGSSRPWRAAAAPSWAKPARSADGVSIESVRSRTPLRTRTASGCSVAMTMPARAGR